MKLIRAARHVLTFFPSPLLTLVVACTPATTQEEQDPAEEPTLCPALDGAGKNEPTKHSGAVRGEEVWRAEDSPHLVTGDLDVVEGGKLVIEPCALVRLAANANLNVAGPLTPDEGELVAEGSEEEPIRFERAGESPWGRLFVHHPGTARLAWVTLDGGGAGDAPRVGETLGARGDGQLPPKPALFVDHVTVSASTGAGVLVDGGAAFAEGSTRLRIEGSGDDEHPYPLVVGEQAIDSVPDGSYTGNRRDEILIEPEVVSGGNGIQVDTTMRHHGVPWRVGLLPENSNLQVGSGQDGAHAPTLTIEAGVTLRFTARTELFVAANDVGPAKLRAVGTQDQPVTFTSAEETPAPGDWQGLWFAGRASAENRLEHVRIEYTGAGCDCALVTCSAGVETFEAALIFVEQPRSSFLAHSVIAHAAGHGVFQSWDGASFDWTSTNEFEDVSGCKQTEPRRADTWCDEPAPECE